jgi:hypothetical protein
MCQEIYFSTPFNSVNLELKDSSGFWVSKVKEPTEFLRSILKYKNIYEVGSFMGCTCGLIFDDDLKNDNYEKRVENAHAFIRFLRNNLNSISEVITLFDYPYSSREEFPQRFLNVAEQKQLTFFELENDSIYALVLDIRRTPSN